jgi:uncharacterized protein (TIGR00269 family)
MIACDRCSEHAVYFSRGDGTHLCRAHLMEQVEAKTAGMLASYTLAENERIAVALSGGKDSTVLLWLLNMLLGERAADRLVAITVDEGIRDYRDETLAAARRLTHRLGIRHIIVSFQDLFGADLDSLLIGNSERACSVCGVYRRQALQQAAVEAGADVLATGHCLDDEAQSVLMNYLRGDLTRIAGAPLPEGTRYIPRIKPLGRVSEKEVVVYGMVASLLSPLPECPYTAHALRAEVRRALGVLEYRFPGTMLRIVEGEADLKRTVSGMIPPSALSKCSRCGNPCSGTLCQRCKIEALLDRRGNLQ